MTTASFSTPAPSSAQATTALIGRVLLASLFLPAGWSKLTGFAGVVGYIASKGLPLPEIGAVVAIAVELLAGLALLAGWRTRHAALVLALFTLVATVVFHNFWAVPEAQKMVQQLLFSKNIAVIGGLLTLAAWRAGRFSVDGGGGRA